MQVTVLSVFCLKFLPLNPRSVNPWLPDAVFDGVWLVARKLDLSTGAIEVGGYGLVADPRHRASLKNVDALDVR